MSIKNTFIILGALFLFFAFRVDKVYSQSFPNNEFVSKKMDSLLKKSDLPALVAIAVNKKGERIEYTYGPAIWGEEQPVKANHVFRIASMTKLLTAVAALQLVEKGDLQLDEDLSVKLPEMTSIPILTNEGKLIEGKNPITLRHLLTHTSGFGYTLTDSLLHQHDRSNWKYDDLPRRFESGTQFLYGSSIDWVGKLVEKASGLSLEKYFKKHITGPLQMKRTAFNLPRSLQKEIVSHGQRGKDEMTALTVFPNRIPLQKTKSYSGGGGLYSTPEDYTKLLVCLLNDGTYPNGQLLSAATIEEMFQAQLEGISMNIEGNYFQKGLCCNFSGLIQANSNWSLIGLMDMKDTPNGRKKGTVSWGGIFNTYWFIDRESGIIASIYTQHLPFNHKATTNIFEEFTQLIYQHDR